MRHNKSKLIIDIIFYTVLAISVVLAVVFYVKIDQLTVSPAPLDTFLYWSYILLAVTVFIAFIIAPILGFIHNPKSAIKALVAIVVLAIVLGISASLASPEPTPGSLISASPAAWKWADILIYTTYILGGLGILAIIVSELKAVFN